MKEQEILFYHGVTRDGRRFTIAGRYIFKHNTDAFLTTAISMCSENDPFVKKTGRNKATGRLISKSYKGCYAANMYSTRDFRTDTPLASFSSNWFKGKEVNIFIEYAKQFNNYSYRELLNKYFLL